MHQAKDITLNLTDKWAIDITEYITPLTIRRENDVHDVNCYKYYISLTRVAKPAVVTKKEVYIFF